MYNPVSTYRIQFNKDFTLQNLDALVPYFKRLGIKTIYASPIFAAVPGSMHGYDVVNPYSINPEIGTEKELRDVIAKLQREGIGWIQDIVPNHMAYHHANPWLMDVLEKGSMSVYASFFDVTWAGEFFNSRIMAPFLAGPLEEMISKKKLQLFLDQSSLRLKIGDSIYPINTRSMETILRPDLNRAPESIRQFLTQVNQIHQVTDRVMYTLRSREVMMQFGSLMSDPESKTYVEDCLEAVNNTPERLQQIVDLQFYRLCSWKETDHKINYRRFFTVNSLICLNMADEKVFTQYHQVIKSFVEDGLFQGLRVDHIDGLYDPLQYLERLRNLCGEDLYIVVEKILEPGEKLNTRWPIQGTTGYEFLSFVNNLFTRNHSENKFSAFYNTLSRDKRPITKQIQEKKSAILYGYMEGELENLYHLCLNNGLLNDTAISTIPENNLKAAIAGFLIHCPVYRFYGNAFPLDPDEHNRVHQIFEECKKDKPELTSSIDLLQDGLLKKTLQDDPVYRKHAIEFYQRCMQFCGPLMAKGVEDTLMYTFNRFVGHNEVGDSPEFFGLTTDDFHRNMVYRQQHWPRALNATSTHDTKRGEDVRMRLNVLPDLDTEWIDLVKKWVHENQSLKVEGSPDLNDEYLIYQTLVGVYPTGAGDDLLFRLEEYFTKALREAKRYSNWAQPDENYEQATRLFIAGLLKKDSVFLNTFGPFQKKISDFGVINSLSQLILKFTCPGVPDVYQGTAGWDLNLVDPDNRRAVDYNYSDSLIGELENTEGPINMSDLWAQRENGKIKHWMLRALLAVRNEYKDVFLQGTYIPLEVRGTYKNNCIAFARKYKQTWIISIAPLSIGRLTEDQKSNLFSIDWSDTCVVLPGEAPLAWHHLLQHTKGNHEGKISLHDVCKELPMALLKLEDPPRERNAGILMSVSSLPSRFGVGDFGKEAINFADFLIRSRQSLWQLLPLNATSDSVGYSPYSAYSSMAGNSMFISLEGLAEEGLLTEKELAAHEIKKSLKVNYKAAEKIKNILLERAWENFQRSLPKGMNNEFGVFLQKENYWLDDFSWFEVIRKTQQGRPWYEWPDALRRRDSTALATIKRDHEHEILKIKWIQFVFLKQWKRLKSYCNNNMIQLVGDLPFYVSHDSADVWSHPEYFSLDERGHMKGMAGVPPDYFNGEGQLWGMPVFRWDELKKNNYDWWIRRIEKNLELYDILRLDHFRAFSDYWEVPAGAANAITGSWQPGPGSVFFTILKQKAGKLPFIAEDLGEMNHGVFELRDACELPGMKILQFAFGADMQSSLDIPHHYTRNFIVYTGTHDNNTTCGWYRRDIDDSTRRRIGEYLNTPIREKTITHALIRLAYSSVAKTAIIPMQDILNLNEASRMNMPSTTAHNWTWRMNGRSGIKHEEALRKLTRLYNR